MAERYPRRNCTACGKPIIWMMTRDGRKMPVNAETVQPTDTVFERGRHTSHFDTCPHSEQFGRRRMTRD